MDPSSVPLLAWHFVAVNNCVNPMLAFCRGDVVHFLLVSCSVMVSAVRPPTRFAGNLKLCQKKKIYGTVISLWRESVKPV